MNRHTALPLNEVIDRLRGLGNGANGSIHIPRGHLIEDLGCIALESRLTSPIAQDELATLLSSENPTDPDDHQVSLLCLEEIVHHGVSLTPKAAAALADARQPQGDDEEVISFMARHWKGPFIYFPTSCCEHAE